MQGNFKQGIVYANHAMQCGGEDPKLLYNIARAYEELEEISVVTKDGKHIILIKDGRFVLPGTEILNEPLKQLEN